MRVRIKFNIILQNFISNSWGKQKKENQYHDGDFIPDKTSNNGAFLKLFKTLTARVLSSLKILGYAFQFFNLIKHWC